MKSILKTAGLVFALALLISAQALAQATNVSGEWAFTVTTDQGAGNPVLTFKQDGEKLTGKYAGQLGAADLTGHREGQRHSLHVHPRRPGPAGAGHLRRHRREEHHEGKARHRRHGVRHLYGDQEIVLTHAVVGFGNCNCVEGL